MLTGKVAIITGSTSGIGLSIAEKLAEAGASIVINGFGEPDKIAELCKKIEKTYQVSVAYIEADLALSPGPQELITKAYQTFGRLDVLVNNAGIQHVAPIETFPAEKWETILALNLSAAFYGIQAALPIMKVQKWGRIINIASAHGLVASAFKSAYVAAKHGLLGLTKTVALETAQENITCNAICPGWVLTPLVEGQIQEKAQQQKISYEEASRALLSEKQPALWLKSIRWVKLSLRCIFQATLTDFGIPACVILLRRQQIKWASPCWLFQFLELSFLPKMVFNL